MESSLKPSGGPEGARLTPLARHRHIKPRTTEIELRSDGTFRTVHVLYTDLELNRSNKNYGAGAVEDLVTRIQTHQKCHHEMIRLRTVP